VLYYKWVYVPSFLLFRHFQRRVAERFPALDEMMQLYGSFGKQYTTPKNKGKRKSKGLVWIISLPLPPPVPLAFQLLTPLSRNSHPPELPSTSTAGFLESITRLLLQQTNPHQYEIHFESKLLK